RVLAADAARLISLRIDPAPDADERILLPLPADRRLLRVAGEHAGLRRQGHQDVHDRVPDRLELAAGPAAGALEQSGPGEEGAAAVEGHAVARVARRRQRLEAQAARLEVAGHDW